MASAISPNLLIVSLAATLGGSVMGDHCSPISDTTILSSTGAGCEHVQHVSTQLPYALLVGGCCMVGYLVAGFTDGNVWLTLLAGFGALLVLLTVLHRHALKKRGHAEERPGFSCDQKTSRSIDGAGGFLGNKKPPVVPGAERIIRCNFPFSSYEDSTAPYPQWAPPVMGSPRR